MLADAYFEYRMESLLVFAPVLALGICLICMIRVMFYLERELLRVLMSTVFVFAAWVALGFLYFFIVPSIAEFLAMCLAPLFPHYMGSRYPL